MGLSGQFHVPAALLISNLNIRKLATLMKELNATFKILRYFMVRADTRAYPKVSGLSR
jgi:hypothetical protein